MILFKGIALATNRDHSVIFELAFKYCILHSFVDYDGYSISSKGFLPTVVDIMGAKFKKTSKTSEIKIKIFQCNLSKMEMKGKVNKILQF